MMNPYNLDEKKYTETLWVVKRVGGTGRSLAPRVFSAPKWVFVTATKRALTIDIIVSHELIEAN